MFLAMLLPAADVTDRAKYQLVDCQLVGLSQQLPSCPLELRVVAWSQYCIATRSICRLGICVDFTAKLLEPYVFEM